MTAPFATGHVKVYAPVVGALSVAIHCTEKGAPPGQLPPIVGTVATDPFPASAVLLKWVCVADATDKAGRQAHASAASTVRPRGAHAIGCISRAVKSCELPPPPEAATRRAAWRFVLNSS